jgi:CRISPR-associated endonuclease Cas1
MHYETSSPLSYSTLRGGVCVVEGYGVRVCVRHGRLVVCDGFPGERRERRYSRVKPGISRLVLLGHAGAVTLEALRWLADVGISFLQIDKDGRLLATSAPTQGDARVRRAQALAFANPTGLQVARLLLGEKLAGQRRVLHGLTVAAEVRREFDALVAQLEAASSLEEMLIAERDAAFNYWGAWSAVVLRFRPFEIARLPEHWVSFGQRSSPFTSAPRLAANPANALLNYLYAILEAETRIACLAVGLDPTLGIVHADQRSRDSLALDLMEAVRPDVDSYLLDLLERRIFHLNDFHETRRGVCRLLPPMTRLLAETAPGWARLIAPVAERVAAILAEAPGSKIDRLPTPLTNTNRHTRRQAMRRRPPAAVKPKGPKPPATCRGCGGEVPHPDRDFCDGCLPAYEKKQKAAFAGSGLFALQSMKAEGRDPTHGGEAAKRRGESTAARKRAIREWERAFGKVADLSRPCMADRGRGGEAAR